MHRRLLGYLAVPVILTFIQSAAAPAQIRASERGSVSQTVDGTRITVDYARPRARGRSELFGGEIKWGEVWTPGANMATTLEVSKPIQLDGHPVAAGKYSVWMEVKEHGDWTMILDTTTHLFHTQRPKPDSTHQIRYSIHPESGPVTEVLTWSFSDISATSTTLAMQWGRVRVPLTIRVEPSHPITLSSDSARRYVGSYQLTTTDTVPKVSTFSVKYVSGSLWSDWSGAPFPDFNHMLLIRIADGWFIPAIWKDGAIYDVMDDLVLEFKGDSGAATGFDLRAPGDDLWATAVRK